jgi:UPF0716 protein FxsA
MAKLFLLFLSVPLIEIYFLIQIGDVIGAGFTLFMIVLTAVIGAGLVRVQGLTTLARAQQEMLSNRVPTMEVIEGALLLLAGAMLLIPGFVSDALGFLILVPPLRQALVRRFLRNRVTPAAQVYEGQARDDDRIIDIDYRDHDRE